MKRKIKNALISVSDKENLKVMANIAKEFGRPQAAFDIANLINSLLGGK